MSKSTHSIISFHSTEYATRACVCYVVHGLTHAHYIGIDAQGQHRVAVVDDYGNFVFVGKPARMIWGKDKQVIAG